MRRTTRMDTVHYFWSEYIFRPIPFLALRHERFYSIYIVSSVCCVHIGVALYIENRRKKLFLKLTTFFSIYNSRLAVLSAANSRFYP